MHEQDASASVVSTFSYPDFSRWLLLSAMEFHHLLPRRRRRSQTVTAGRDFHPAPKVMYLVCQFVSLSVNQVSVESIGILSN